MLYVLICASYHLRLCKSIHCFNVNIRVIHSDVFTAGSIQSCFSVVIFLLPQSPICRHLMVHVVYFSLLVLLFCAKGGIIVMKV